MKLNEIGNILGNNEIKVHFTDLPLNTSARMNQADRKKPSEELNKEVLSDENKKNLISRRKTIGMESSQIFWPQAQNESFKDAEESSKVPRKMSEDSDAS